MLGVDFGMLGWRTGIERRLGSNMLLLLLDTLLSLHIVYRYLNVTLHVYLSAHVYYLNWHCFDGVADGRQQSRLEG